MSLVNHFTPVSEGPLGFHPAQAAPPALPQVELIGSPLTHERFLRRHRGSYGPELRAGERDFPGAKTPVPKLLVCGDSSWPGIGVPAVAGSGIAAAHAVVGFGEQRQLLQKMREQGLL